MPTLVATARKCFSKRFSCVAVVAPFASTLAVLAGADALPQAASPVPPRSLQETGLYSDFETRQVDPQHLSFSPQYPLWTDGATKRRWISLPPGTAIDGSDPDAWKFPVGTRFWKEFSFGGQPIETRFLERQADGQWLYAAYAWSSDGRGAELVSEKGKRGAVPLGNGRSHTIPSVNDCKACHQGGRTEVLGFSTLQLSPDRDPLALHSEASDTNLHSLVERGFLVGLPKHLLDAPPRIAGSATQRSALGYLHGNCGHCHNEKGSLANLGLFLRQTSEAAVQGAIASTFNQPVRKSAPGQSPDAVMRILPGRPDQSALVQRVSSRYSALQMPPLGTELIDKEAVALLRSWIAEAESLPLQRYQETTGR
jgi:hypothetical protein